MDFERGERKPSQDGRTCTLPARWREGDTVKTPGMLVDAATCAYLRHHTLGPVVLKQLGEDQLALAIFRFRAYTLKKEDALQPLLDTYTLDDILVEGPLRRLTQTSDEKTRLAAIDATARHRAFRYPPSKYRDQGYDIARAAGLPDEEDHAYTRLCHWFDNGGVDDTEAGQTACSSTPQAISAHNTVEQTCCTSRDYLVR